MTDKPRTAEDVARDYFTWECDHQEKGVCKSCFITALTKFRDDGVREAQANIDSLERGKIYDVAFQLGMKKGFAEAREKAANTAQNHDNDCPQRRDMLCGWRISNEIRSLQPDGKEGKWCSNDHQHNHEGCDCIDSSKCNCDCHKKGPSNDRD